MGLLPGRDGQPVLGGTAWRKRSGKGVGVRTSDGTYWKTRDGIARCEGISDRVDQVRVKSGGLPG